MIPKRLVLRVSIDCQSVVQTPWQISCLVSVELPPPVMTFGLFVLIVATEGNLPCPLSADNIVHISSVMKEGPHFIQEAGSNMSQNAQKRLDLPAYVRESGRRYGVNGGEVEIQGKDGGEGGGQANLRDNG